MAVPSGGTYKRREPIPTSFLHNHVQRSGMVSNTLFYPKHTAIWLHREYVIDHFVSVATTSTLSIFAIA